MKEFILTTHADHNPLVAALREEGVDVRSVSWKQALPNLVGCVAFYGNLFDEIKDWFGLIKLKQQLNRSHVPYVFWNRDAPWNTGIKTYNRCAMQIIKPVNIYLSHSLQGARWFGGEAHLFPNAAQPDYFRDTNLVALQNESEYKFDVSFFGSFANVKDRNARERERFLAELQGRLKQMVPEVRFKAIDTSWQPLSLAEQLMLIRTSKININVGAMCDLPGKPSWGFPERVFGIPGAGGFVISDSRKHQKDIFPISAFPVFDTPEACSGLIIELLKNFNQIRTLAEAQYEHILERHTYQHRALQFLDILRRYQRSTTQ